MKPLENLTSRKATFFSKNGNNSELYLHDYNNTALQKREKRENYNNLVMTIRVKSQH